MPTDESANPHDGHEPREPGALVRHYLRDLVFGANDGIVTTFAIVTGATGAALEHRIVVILGLANLLADGFSMGASNFLSIRSDEAARRIDGHPMQEPFPFRHGLATFAAFVVAGWIPLLSYTLDLGTRALPVAVALTMLALFVVGALRATVAAGGWLKSGLEMLIVGALAASVAYGVGALVAPFTG